MRPDITRDTHQPKKFYTKVVLEQGRVQLDADWNEQQSIHQQQRETTTRDVIGPGGAPEGNPGFIITANGTDLLIDRGQLYVDGILCVYDLPDSAPSRSISQQPFLGTAPDLTTIQVGLVYLDVWERHVTWRDDPRIRERALGGPDTASRSQTVWQVKVLGLPAALNSAELADFRYSLRNDVVPVAPALGPWRNLIAARDNRLNARTNIAAAVTDPCLLPPGAGYQGLENQLYRVEIHNSNPPTFKWSRENGSVAVDIESVSGAEIIVSSTGRDILTTFQGGDWVELVRDVNVLDETPGILLQVLRSDSNERKITLTANAPITLSVAEAEAQNAQLRQWNHNGPNANAGIALPAGWFHMENGVEVLFSAGTYRTGDYWLIPARTSTGEIEWPPFSIPNTNPQAQPPAGVIHHYYPLAIVNRTATSWDVEALSRVFPPLTNIKAADVFYTNGNCLPDLGPAQTVQEAIDLLCRRGGGECTIYANPGSDLAALFAAIGPGADAKICFAIGRYDLTNVVNVTGKGHLTLEGCGPSTEIVVNGQETALRFDNCASVHVEKMQMVSEMANTVLGSANLQGVLTFLDCGRVTVQDVDIRCAHGTSRAATCVTIRYQPGQIPNLPNDALNQRLVRILRCNFAVGHMQTAVLLVNTRRAHVEDNVIDVVAKPARFAFDRLVVESMHFRAQARGLLVKNGQIGLPAAGMPTNVSVTVGGQTIHLLTDPLLAQPALWTSMLAAEARPGESLARTLNRVADRILLQDPIAMSSSQVRSWYKLVLAEDVSVVGQGIVIGGQVAPDVRILNNTLRGTLQGIHVGVSHAEVNQGAADRSHSVLISNNTIEAYLPPNAIRERHGLFVGNCNSLMIENNYLSLRRFNTTTRFRMEGIRIFGYLGKRMIIRHNDTTGFNPGIRVNPLNNLGDPSNDPLWLVADNAAFVEVTNDNTNVPLPSQKLRVDQVNNHA